MMDARRRWAEARDRLAASVAALGFPAELADLLARQLGSPQAIDRLTSYVWQARPNSLETLVDETLAIRDEIAAWREKRDSREAQAGYSRWLNSRQRAEILWAEEDGEEAGAEDEA